MKDSNNKKLAQKAIEDLNKESYSKLENVIEPILLKNIIEFFECYRFKNNINNSLDKDPNASKFHGDSTVINNLHSLDILFWELISNPIITSICENILSKYSYKNSEGYVLIGSSIRALYNPRPAQQLHIDSNLPGNNHILSIQFCIPLDNFNQKNGATQIVRGSNLIKDYPPNNNELSQKNKEKLLILDAKPGDLIIFNTGIWHGSSAKLNKERRAAVFLNFGRWFIKPTFDIPNNMTDKIYKSLTTNQKKIAGCFCQPPFSEKDGRGRKSLNPIRRKYIEELF